MYLHYNKFDGIVKLTDADGSVVASFTYGTYGELLSGSTAFTRFLYNGRCGVTTDDNGLYYMRQRYYSSELKRFVNQDVVKGSIGNSQSLNRYSYVQGNPVSYTDPFGLSPEDGKFTASPWVHGLFGLLGCIPGPVGAVANIADAILYLAEGDYMSAAISFLDGFTMGATAVATKLLKAKKLCKVATTAVKMAQATERISGGLSFIQNGRNINKTVSTMYQKYVVEGQSMGWDTVGEGAGLFMSLMGCGSGLRRMGSTSNELAVLQRKAEAGQLCFVAGTKIKTADGDKNIEDIEVGDEVYSSDVETGEVGLKHVTRLSVNEAQDMAHVTIDGETITATTTHPFYVEGYGFKPAGELKTGDKVRLLDGGSVEVEAVVVEHLDEPVKVYNFEVEDWHTYYVAGAGVLVHNRCKSNSKILRENMLAAGEIEPIYNNAAHHIVAVRSKKAKEAQAIMRKYKVDINSAENGVFLPTQKGVSKAAYHPSLHTNAYYNKVNSLLREANSKEDVIDILKSIRKSLQEGTF